MQLENMSTQELFNFCERASGDAAQDQALRCGGDPKEYRRHAEAHERYLNDYGPPQTDRLRVLARAKFLASTKPRRVGDAGETRCGDLLGDHTRRRCGGCASTAGAHGCGDVLERDS